MHHAPPGLPFGIPHPAAAAALHSSAAQLAASEATFALYHAHSALAAQAGTGSGPTAAALARLPVAQTTFSQVPTRAMAPPARPPRRSAADTAGDGGAQGGSEGQLAANYPSRAPPGSVGSVAGDDSAEEWDDTSSNTGAGGGGGSKKDARREYHKKIERKRRDRMRSLYDQLRSLVKPVEPADKNAILQGAVALIQGLKEKNSALAGKLIRPKIEVDASGNQVPVKDYEGGGANENENGSNDGTNENGSNDGTNENEDGSNHGSASNGDRTSGEGEGSGSGSNEGSNGSPSGDGGDGSQGAVGSSGGSSPTNNSNDQNLSCSDGMSEEDRSERRGRGQQGAGSDGSAPPTNSCLSTGADDPPTKRARVGR